MRIISEKTETSINICCSRETFLNLDDVTHGTSHPEFFTVRQTTYMPLTLRFTFLPVTDTVYDQTSVWSRYERI